MTTWFSRGWPVAAASVGTVLIGCGAFWLSFTSLADLARRSGIAAGQAWTWPLLVDGLIVVATVAVVALDRRQAAWYPWTLLIVAAGVSVLANAAHAVVAAETRIPGVLAALIAAVPPLVLLASTHLTVVLNRTTPAPAATVQQERPPDAELSPGASDAPAAVVDDRPAHQQSVMTVEHESSVPTTAKSASPTTDTASTDDSSAALDDAPNGEQNPVADAVGPDPQVVGSPRRQAGVLRDQGWTNRAIAAELGVHPSTVGRWFARAHPTDNHHTSSTEGETS